MPRFDFGNSCPLRDRVSAAADEGSVAIQQQEVFELGNML